MLLLNWKNDGRSRQQGGKEFHRLAYFIWKEFFPESVTIVVILRSMRGPLVGLSLLQGLNNESSSGGSLILTILYMIRAAKKSRRVLLLSHLSYFLYGVMCSSRLSPNMYRIPRLASLWSCSRSSREMSAQTTVQ